MRSRNSISGRRTFICPLSLPAQLYSFNESLLLRNLIRREQSIMEGLIPYVCRAITRRKSRRFYESLYSQTSADASNLESGDKWEGKPSERRHRRMMSLPACLGQNHQIPLSIPAINEEKEEDMNGCMGGGVIIFRKGGSLRLPSPNQRW